MNYPLLTICLLTHNSEKTIRKTLQSILDQSYSNLEVLVSDNGSKDRTEEIIKSFQDPRISLRRNIPDPELNTESVGCFINCNGCIKSGLIKGEFVSFYHSDDIYEKKIVEKEVEFLVKNPQVAAVFALGNIINKEDKIIGRLKLPKKLRKKNIYNFMEIFRALLNNGNVFLQTPTFMTRKNIFKKVGLFNEEKFRTSADLEMWLRILEKYPIGILEENLINLRIGGAGMKYQYLCTERAEFFKVMNYYLEAKLIVHKIEKKFLRQYEYQKRFNDTLRAMNFLIKEEEEKAKVLVNKKPSFDIFRAFFENLYIRKIKEAILRLVLITGINLKLGKPLGKILYKLRY